MGAQTKCGLALLGYALSQYTSRAHECSAMKTTKHCFRCGTTNVVTDGVTCPDCGEPSLYTLIEALDMLNDLYVKGGFSIAKRRREEPL